MTQGYRSDEGKAPWHLLPTDAVEQVVKVLQHGAKKYEPRNWERGMAWSRCWDSMMRHAIAWQRGEDLDPETGLSHMAHAACNALFLAAYVQRDYLAVWDDRERLSLRDPRALHKPQPKKETA